MEMLGVVLLGAMGVGARFALEKKIPTEPGAFPFTLFMTNVLGCFVAGAVYVLAQEKGMLSQPWRTALLVGFCGGFTTFSAYGLQGLLLIEAQAFRNAMLSLVLTPVVGFAAAWLGWWLVRRWL